MEREVNTLALSLLFGYVERQRKTPLGELLAGLRYGEAELRATGGWIDWGTYAELERRIRARFPDEPDLFLHAGRSAIDLEAFGFVRVMASLVFDVRSVYRVVQRATPSFLFRCLTIERRDVGDVMELTYRLRPGLAPVPGFFDIVQGILEQLPLLVGDERAAVTQRPLDPLAVTFVVRLAPGVGVLRRVRTVAGNWLHWYPRAMSELEETNKRLQEQYGQLERAYREISEYRTRLEAMVDERTSQLSRANRSLEQSVSRLEALDKAKSELFANVSHELRTPLTMILGPVTTLLDGVVGPLGARQRELLGAAYENSRRLLRQVNNLLDMAKLEAGQMRLRFRPARVDELVGSLVASARGAAEAHGIALELESPSAVEPVQVDPEQIEKVVLNIVGNAIKFTPRGGRIRVRVDETTGFVRVAVADSGEGIPPEQRERIFERFTQVDGSATRRHGGTGIGLALVREIVALHAGHIDVESELGKGSTFTVWLPKGTAHVTDDVADRRTKDVDVGVKRRATDQELVRVEEVLADVRALHVADVGAAVPGGPAEDVEAGPEGPGPDAPLVLVVEDDPDVRRYLSFALAGRFRVVAAADGLKGLAAALESSPDAVVSDVMMPGIDGIELVRRLRADARSRAVPVLLVTARAEPEARLRGLEAGADDYLLKPFSTRELLTRLTNLIRLRAFERDLARRNDELELALRNLRHAQSSLVAQARMASLGQLVAGVAHELNNPANFLCGATFAIEEKLAGGEPTAQALAEVRKLAGVARVGGERVADIVESLRRFSGRGRPRGPTDLAEGVRVTLALLEPRVRESKARVEVELAGPLIVVANAGEIHQVLMNLLTNALQAAAGGTVRVRGGRENGDAWIGVEDDGPGIAAEVLPHIFEPFFTTRDPGQGTGLGLSISDSIARAHGGRIEARSEPGRGAAFRLVLPAV
ncbi:MAG: response regulator [Deltaproteobacteria bacterium]|nr:response regulator [Deltaproteobacteria bacterium]